MNTNTPPTARTDMGSMGGGYAGAQDMINNGLSANQNQVSPKQYTGFTILHCSEKFSPGQVIRVKHPVHYLIKHDL